MPIFNCPTRRRSVVEVSTSDAPYNSNLAAHAAKTDYAANSGYPYPYYPYTVQGPQSIAQGDAWTAQNAWPDLSTVCQGISYLRSQVTLAMIFDGPSNTYMLGEKYLNPNAYFNGTDPADNESLYSGYNNDTNRSGNGWQPFRDMPGYTNADTFGSTHITSFDTVFCDGSVRNFLWHRPGNPSPPELYQRRSTSRCFDLLVIAIRSYRPGDGQSLRCALQRWW